MNPLFQSLIVGLVPQPVSVPPKPFETEKLQRVYLELTPVHPYSQFQLAPAGGGAQLMNDPSDVVVIQQMLLQLQTPVTLTKEKAREKAIDVLKVVSSRLGVSAFLQLGIKIVAHVPAPNNDAKSFVSEKLMRSPDQSAELGSAFFGGGVKFRAIEGFREQVLLLEPFVRDNAYLWIDYDVQLAEPFDGLEKLSTWIDEAFEFVSRNTMKMLEA